MQSELCLRLLGPICVPREPNYDPVEEGLTLLNISIETDSVHWYLDQLASDPNTYDDLWFLESSCKILLYVNKPFPQFDEWYQGLEFNQRRELLDFSLQVFLFQPIFQQLLDMCSFFGANLGLLNYRQTVYVVLYRFIQQKFNFRPRLSDSSHCISKICQVVAKSRVQLNAELARLRVEEGATTLRHLLSEESRQQLNSQSRSVIHLRTTKLFTDTLESCTGCSIGKLLYRLGLVGAASIEELLNVPANSHQYKYMVISKDLIAVSTNSYSYFHQHSLTGQGYLQLVELSGYNLVSYSSSHVDPSEDVILTHFGSGAECIQLSDSLHSDATLHVFSTYNVADARAKLSQYRINNVMLYSEHFVESDQTTIPLSKVKSIICLPPNSQTSIKSKLLPALSDVTCLSLLFKPSQVIIIDVIGEQRRILAYSLRCNFVSNVLYFVHSNSAPECGDVITAELESHTEQASSLEQRTFYLNPVIHGAYCPDSQGFLSVASSMQRSGYFVASLVRIPPPPPPKPVEVIAKAICDGLIQLPDTDIEGFALKKTQKVKKPRNRKPLFSSSKEPIPMTFTARQKVTVKHLFAANLNTKSLHGRPFR